MPLVSVIVPNYNHAAYLDERVRSILDQSFRDFELIILDDCSADNSKEIIEQYRGHEKVSVIGYNTVNSGSAFRQWEKGIGLAKGELVWIAESDDSAHKDFLGETVAIHKQYEDVGLVFTQGIAFTTDPGQGEKVLTGEAFQSAFHKNGHKFIEEFLIEGNQVYNASGVLFKKKILQQHNIKIETGFRLCGDWLFWVSVLKYSNVYYSGKPLNYFRSNIKGVTASTSFLLSYPERLKVVEFIGTFINSPKIEQVKEDLLYQAMRSYKVSEFRKMKKELAVYGPHYKNFNSLFSRLKNRSIFARIKQKLSFK